LTSLLLPSLTQSHVVGKGGGTLSRMLKRPKPSQNAP